MQKRHYVIIFACLVFGAADYYTNHFPESSIAEFFRVNNSAIGLVLLILFSVVFFLNRKAGRK
ncbi:MAG: hypothetical protein P4N59_30255 [Negativicutes bacterium]|nr:hypothetical protein [Negativicutes bacterium]